MAASVLIVDDDGDFRRLAERILSAAGLQVIGDVPTVRDAQRAAATLRPDAVLVDVGLPDGDGVSLAFSLMALPWRPRVVLTSTDSTVSLMEARLDGTELVFVPKTELPTAPLGRLLGSGVEE